MPHQAAGSHLTVTTRRFRVQRRHSRRRHRHL